MLRACTPGPVPHLRSPSPVEGIRRQIVDMVRITDHEEGRGTATIIYDLRQRQVIQREVTPNRPTDIRRLPAKIHKEEIVDSQELDTTKSSGSFPQPCKTSTPNLQRRDFRRVPEGRRWSPSRSKTTLQTPSPPRPSRGNPESTKRPRMGQGRTLRSKTIRLQNDTSGPHCQSSDASSPNSDEKTTSKTSGEPCEVRGSAISVSPTRPRIMSPVKRAEVQRRSTLFSASLELFRRRLKMNQSKFFSCNKVNPDEYVIRKEDERKSSAKSLLKGSCLPTPPKTASPKRVVQTDIDHPVETSQEKTRYSYRLPDVHDDEKEVPFGEVRALPQVHTYVLEDKSTDQVRRRSFKEPAPLTSHNLNIHNMFMEQQRRRPRVESNGVIYDARVWRWVEESNAHSRVQRVVRFNISPNQNTERVAISDSSRVVSSSDKSRD